MSDRVNRARRRFLGAAAMTIAAAQLGMTGCGGQQMTGSAGQLLVEGELPSLGGATGWLNSQPPAVSSLRGKVVLVQFCT
jgi:hypothetical protein